MSEQLALGKLTARSALLLNRFVGLGGVPAAINKTPQKRLLPTREQPDAPVRDETSQRLRSRAERHLHPHGAAVRQRRQRKRRRVGDPMRAGSVSSIEKPERNA